MIAGTCPSVAGGGRTIAPPPLRIDRHQRRGKTAVIVIAVIVGVLVTLGLVCGIGGTLFVRAGMSMYAEDAVRLANDRPVITERLGTITDAKVHFSATMAEDHDDVLAVDLTGTLGSGRLLAQFIDQPDGSTTLGPGALILNDGTQLDLATGKPTTGTPWRD